MSVPCCEHGGCLKMLDDGGDWLSFLGLLFLCRYLHCERDSCAAYSVEASACRRAILAYEITTWKVLL